MFESILIVIVAFVVSFAVGELVGIVPFRIIRQKLGTNTMAEQEHKDFADRLPTNKLIIFKGSIERFALLLGLVSSFPQILIVFGALKIGTRFKEKADDPISNDYFLIGNLTSVSIAIGMAAVFRVLVAQKLFFS